MPIDHTNLSVPKHQFKGCLELYLKALEPLGYEIRYEFGEHLVGLGAKDAEIADYNRADFWVAGVDIQSTPAHIAFSAKDRKMVDAFHAAALRAGAKDNGAPGLRTHYHPHYYGAYVLDLAGNNIEVVCHSPQS